MRLFVGIDLPPRIKDLLADISGDLPDLRWVVPENLHLTLCFLGEVGQHRLLDLKEALEEVALEGPAAFEMSLRGLGQFLMGKGERALTQGSILWVGAQAGPELNRLQSRVKRALIDVDLPPEKKKFVPHVTLARSKFREPRGIHEYLEARHDFATEPFPVESFELFSSRLRQEGPVYSIEESYDLAPGAGGAS